jgi:hypothetical protein
MNLSDGRHPIWSILRMAVLMGGACLILSITASHFDAGELKAAGGVGAASLTFDLLKRAFVKET